MFQRKSSLVATKLPMFALLFSSMQPQAAITLVRRDGGLSTTLLHSSTFIMCEVMAEKYTQSFQLKICIVCIYQFTENQRFNLEYLLLSTWEGIFLFSLVPSCCL